MHGLIAIHLAFENGVSCPFCFLDIEHSEQIPRVNTINVFIDIQTSKELIQRDTDKNIYNQYSQYKSCWIPRLMPAIEISGVLPG